VIDIKDSRLNKAQAGPRAAALHRTGMDAGCTGSAHGLEAMMRRADFEDTRALPVFHGVEPATVDALLQASFVQHFPAHMDILLEGETPEFMHVLMEGRVGLVATHGTRETILDVLAPGKAFIVSAVMLDRPYLVTARALSPSRLLLMPAELVRRAFLNDASFARRIAMELAVVSRGLIKEIKNQKLRTGLERLSNWLLVQDRAAGGRGTFELPIDKRVLAARLGMAPEVLSRLLANLAQSGVTVVGPQITIRDHAALAAVAEPAPGIDEPEGFAFERDVAAS
jgi:CRP/FNR family transcriptional regulator, transcriptional activator FtrB